jgi:hypothetical protein
VARVAPSNDEWAAWAPLCQHSLFVVAGGVIAHQVINASAEGEADQPWRDPPERHGS